MPHLGQKAAFTPSSAPQVEQNLLCGCGGGVNWLGAGWGGGVN